MSTMSDHNINNNDDAVMTHLYSGDLTKWDIASVSRFEEPGTMALFAELYQYLYMHDRKKNRITKALIWGTH